MHRIILETAGLPSWTSANPPAIIAGVGFSRIRCFPRRRPDSRRRSPGSSVFAGPARCPPRSIRTVLGRIHLLAVRAAPAQCIRRADRETAAVEQPDARGKLKSDRSGRGSRAERAALVIRRCERASTLLHSNRPGDDWGKLLGDTVAVRRSGSSEDSACNDEQLTCKHALAYHELLTRKRIIALDWSRGRVSRHR